MLSVPSQQMLNEVMAGVTRVRIVNGGASDPESAGAAAFAFGDRAE